MIHLTCQSIAKIGFLYLFILFSPTFAKGEIYTTPDDHQFEVNLIADKTEIMLGEPVFLSFEFKNLSNVDLSFHNGGDYRNSLSRPESFLVKAVREDGKEVPIPEVNFTFGGLSGYLNVKANGGIEIVRLFLPLWSPFEVTGTYKITCQKSLEIQTSQKAANRSDNIHSVGTQIKVETTIKVVSQTDAEMEKVISFWGDELAGRKDKTSHREEFRKSYEAIKALSYIGGKRIIASLTKAVETPEETPALDAVLRELAGFDDETAFQAILSQMSHKSNSIRSAVADSFSLSKHPRAFGFLLKMKNDEDKFVRLSVIQSLGKIGSPQAIKIIKEMVKEPRNEEFIWYAEFYLKNTEPESNK